MVLRRKVDHQKPLPCWQLLSAVLQCLYSGSLAPAFPFGKVLPAVSAVTVLAVLAWLASTQTTIKSLQLSYVLWAFVGGLFISNVIGIPNWLKPGLRGELYIKTGLVLMGAGLLFGTLMKLGPPGILVSWITTPIVLISTYQFGQRVLKIKSKTLNLVLSADMSVCGVSAAVATSCCLQGEKRRALNCRWYLTRVYRCNDVCVTSGL